MGIITETVEVNVNSYTIKHYESLGYKIPLKIASETYRRRTGKEFVYDMSKTITVKTKDLPESSSTMVKVICDICQKSIMNVRYVDYNKIVGATGSYSCKECSHIKREQTNIIRYGDYYVRTEEFKEKRRKSCIERYGVENPLQNKEIAEKVHFTNLQKYGHASTIQVPEFKEKAKLTMLEHFGVDNAAKSEEVKNKIRTTNIQKYGVEYTMQSPEVRTKANETLCKNGTHKTSKQQLYLHSLYGGEINFPVKYYATDICFPEEKLIIEYDGGGHDLRVTLGRLTQEEFDRKELVRNNIIKREGYKRMNIVSKLDKLPSDTILLQMLSDARAYFTQYPNHSWCEFDLDTSTIRNAENPRGTPYSFGPLRTIKDSDIAIAV